MIASNMNKWDGFRIVLIAVALGGVAAVLGQEFLSNSKGQDVAKNITFPESVPLANWQLVKTMPIAAGSEDGSDPGKRYEYRNKAGDRLEVDTIHQLYTDGNASRLLMVYEKIPPATVIPQTKYKKEIGHYYTFEYQDKAYLSTCMPPDGESVVTGPQYVNHRSRYGWSIPRSFGWVFGQNDFFDGRCLWTVMSIPVDTYSNPTAAEQASEQLENTWLEWHRWWQENSFPS